MEFLLFLVDFFDYFVLLSYFLIKKKKNVLFIEIRFLLLFFESCYFVVFIYIYKFFKKYFYFIEECNNYGILEYKICLLFFRLDYLIL